MVHELFDSPLRPMRQPRFSHNGSVSPNENCPSAAGNGPEPSPSFPRQYMASPAKLNDRNVLYFLGSKIPSSVPGRRSSLGCIKEKITKPPSVILPDRQFDARMDMQDTASLRKSLRRAKSLKHSIDPAPASGASAHVSTLKRL